MKKLTSLFILICMLFSLASCNPTPGTDPSATDPVSGEAQDGLDTDEATTEAVSTEPDPLDFPEENPDREIVLFENGEWKYNMVRPDKMDSAASESLTAMRYVLSKVTSVGIGVSSDYLAAGQAYDDTKCEILFGNTGHLQSISCYNKTYLNESAIYVVGNKIIICSYTANGYLKCQEYLSQLLNESFKDGKLVLKVKDLEKMFNADEELYCVPRPDRLKYSCREECEYGQTLFIFEGATPVDFENYRKKFEAYTLVQEKTEAGNSFATYDSGGNLINISYSKADDNIRVILNRDTAPPAVAVQPASVEKKCNNVVIMHGLANAGADDYQNGICILFRLSDGRFIIVDGGFNRQGDADAIYRLLLAYTPKGMTPTVAGWFITHAHGDHHSAFASKFVASYGKKVVIENVFFNAPSVHSNQTSSNEKTAEDLIINVAASIGGCTLIRPHVGDRYYLGDAVIDFYYTVDQFYPETFTYYNTCSLMFSVTLAGQKIMITGDCANASFEKAIKMFGESLKCDILQVAHHGYGTGVSEGASTAVMRGYQYMAPTLVLWPLGEGHYENLSKKIYNRYLTRLPTVKEIILAGKDDHVVQLPYTYTPK